MHRLRLITVALALTSGCRARERGLYRQCSRATPEHVDGEWTPTLADVAALERELPAFLAAVDTESVFYGRLRPLGSFIRQYGGFTRGGRRFIYASFSLPLPEEVRRELGPDSAAWRRWPTQVCDGGSGFFGLEYDVDRHRFGELHVNGVG